MASGTAVLKFGGAALRDGPAVARACRIVAEAGGARPVVVVSAHEGVTRVLGQLAEEAVLGRVDARAVRVRHRSLLAALGLDSELLDRHFAQLVSVLQEIARRRALERTLLDHVLSMGERMSARVVAAALRASGTRAAPVDAFDIGLVTGADSRPLAPDRAQTRRALDSVPGVPVVTGFLAADASGQVATLGRNGSDWTAALLAEALDAREVQLWKTVDGMMTADPTLVPAARPIERLGWSEAAELARSGASVLHPAAADTVLRARIPVRVLNANRPADPGTRIEPDADCAERAVRRGPVGLAHRERVALIELDVADEQRGALLAELALREARGAPPVLSLSASAGSARLVLDDDGEVDSLCASFAALGASFAAFAAFEGRARARRGLSLLTLVGASTEPRHEPWTECAVAASALSTLQRAGVAPLRSEHDPARVRLLLERADLARAARALHATFFEAGFEAGFEAAFGGNGAPPRAYAEPERGAGASAS